MKSLYLSDSKLTLQLQQSLFNYFYHHNGKFLDGNFHQPARVSHSRNEKEEDMKIRQDRELRPSPRKSKIKKMPHIEASSIPSAAHVGCQCH